MAPAADGPTGRASSTSGPSLGGKHNASHSRQAYCLPLPLPKTLLTPPGGDADGAKGASLADGSMTEPAERGSLSVHSHVGSNAAAGTLRKLVAGICKDAGFDGANASATSYLEHLTQECESFLWSSCL